MPVRLGLVGEEGREESPLGPALAQGPSELAEEPSEPVVEQRPAGVEQQPAGVRWVAV